MTEAVIVSTARSPFGRAFKGSLKEVRPDDLVATVIQAALDKVPALDKRLVEDLYLGCAEPSGRTSLSEPLKARPNGERAVETMTASVTGDLLVQHRRPARRCDGRLSACSVPTMVGRPRRGWTGRRP